MKLSIITISLNNKDGIEQTIKSVLEQTFKDFEYIVIDGGSTDGSKEVIEKYESKIDYWVSEGDKGIYNAMNKGIKVANGEYLLFLNSGDILKSKEILSKVIDKVLDFDLITFDIELVRDGKQWIHYYPNKITFNYLFYASIGHPTTFIKKTLFDTVGLYDENYKIVSDWKFFLLALGKFRATIKKHDIVLSVFQMDGVSSKEFEKVNLEREKILKEEFAFFYDDYIKYKKIKNAHENLIQKLNNSIFISFGKKIGLLKYL